MAVLAGPLVQSRFVGWSWPHPGAPPGGVVPVEEELADALDDAGAELVGVVELEAGAELVGVVELEAGAELVGVVELEAGAELVGGVELELTEFAMVKVAVNTWVAPVVVVTTWVMVWVPSGSLVVSHGLAQSG
jgi:hypothetical protein